MFVFAHRFLLGHQHVDKRFFVLVLLQSLEQRLLRFGHAATDAVTFSLVFAYVDTGRGRLAHQIDYS